MSYKPEFKGPIEGWVVNYSRKIHWRIQRTVPWEDMMQEAALVFLKCRGAYPDLDTPQHFMALFKTAWTRRFCDLAAADTADRVLVSENRTSMDDEEYTPDSVGELDTDGELAVKLRQAPSEVLSVLHLFLSAPQELLDVALAGWRGRDARCKSGGSAQVCRLLGLPEELDVLQMVEDHFR